MTPGRKHKRVTAWCESGGRHDWVFHSSVGGDKPRTVIEEFKCLKCGIKKKVSRSY